MKALIIIFVGAVITMFAGAFGQRRSLPWLASITAALGLGACMYDMSYGIQAGFPGMLTFNRFSLAFTAIILFTTLLIFILSSYSFRHLGENWGDHYALMLFSICGAICMLSYDHLVMLFLGIEILSIPLYVLAGSRKKSLEGNEAALKYFIMGAFTTGILLFGIALVYGATGTFSLEGIGLKLLNEPDSLPSFFRVGVLMIMIALCFKVGAVPFHFWVPDVYQGSPTTITLFMATVVKVAAIGAFFKLFTNILALNFAPTIWVTTLVVISGATMLLANIMATRQSDFKRLMAYSSISHAGFLLMAILSLRNGGSSVLWIYTTVYCLASVAVFAVLIPVVESRGDTAISAFRGLGKEKPFMGAMMAIGLLSMAGIPPTGGFFAKYFLFVLNLEPHFWLVVTGLIASAISVYYYLKVLGEVFFMSPEEAGGKLVVPISYSIVQLICVIGIFLVAIFAQKALVFLLFQ